MIIKNILNILLIIFAIYTIIISIKYKYNNRPFCIITLLLIIAHNFANSVSINFSKYINNLSWGDFPKTYYIFNYFNNVSFVYIQALFECYVIYLLYKSIKKIIHNKKNNNI